MTPVYDIDLVTEEKRGVIKSAQRPLSQVSRLQALALPQNRYVQRLSVFLQGQPVAGGYPYVLARDDHYDGLRDKNNNGRHLYDPAPDLAAFHRLNEKQVEVMAHFRDNQPVNNSHGFQAAHFDPKTGWVTFFAFINSKGCVQKQHINDDLVPELQDVVSYLKDMTAPLACDILPQLQQVLNWSALAPYAGKFNAYSS